METSLDPSVVLDLRVGRIRLASGDIAFVDEGTGPVVLLLHGAPFTSLGFLRVIRRLRASYRVVAPDFPGFGGSAAAPGFGATLRDYAEFVREFCRALALDDFTVYLNDSSACIGLAALCELSREVRGLVVASTVPIPMTGRFRVVKAFLRYVVTSWLARRLNRRFGLLPWLVVNVDPLHAPFAREERRILGAQFEGPDERDRILDVFRSMATDDAFLAETAARAVESFRSTPVLLLYGQFDPMRLLGAVARFRAMFPRHHVHIVRGEKHFPILGSGGAVADALDLWMRTSSAG
jgi:haloalkane dehalogenase